MASDDAPVRDVLDCGSYRLGHTPHYIQAKLSLQDGAGARVSVQMGHEGWMTCIKADGEAVALWTHDPQRLEELLAVIETPMLRSHGVLALPHGLNEHYIVSVATESTPCPDPNENIEDISLIERLELRGGFLVNGQEAAALLGDEFSR